MNRVYEYFTSPVFRGYNYTADAEICPPGASGEVVLGCIALKTVIFEEILTKSRKRKAAAACGSERMISGFRCGSTKKARFSSSPESYEGRREAILPPLLFLLRSPRHP